MNEAELAVFIEETKSIVLSSIRRYLPPSLHHSIDDVVQETYLRVYRTLPGMKFSDESARKNWLYTIAKNESLRIKSKSYKEDEKTGKLIKSIPERSVLPDFLAEDIEFLKEVISLLPEKYRAVFELVALGFSEKEVAMKLSIKAGTVKSRMHRGRELIYRHINRDGGI